MRDDHFYARLRVAARAFVATEQQVPNKNAPEIDAGLDLLYGAARDLAMYELEPTSRAPFDTDCTCPLCVRVRSEAIKARG